MTFNERVLEWVQHKDPLAAVVTSVYGHGTDWDGDTEGGFYSSFSVDIAYERSDGSKKYMGVKGDAMDSLWKWTVNNEVWEDK